MLTRDNFYSENRGNRLLSNFDTYFHQTKHRHILADRNLDTHRHEKVKYHWKPRFVYNVHYAVIHRNGGNFKTLTFHSDNLTRWSEFEPHRKCDQSV